MAGRIPDQFLDELLARTDIVELIGGRIELKRKGREYSARCPFHDERSPSFYVSPIKQFYHCFGCGAHGTALKFLMEYDRLEFLDAVDELAKRAGVEVPRDARHGPAHEDHRELYGALDSAAQFFVRQLAPDVRAKAYLDARGVDAATRDRFQIGYAPAGWDTLKSALGRDDTQRLATLDKAGLLSKGDSGRLYDKFRDRIIFPIHDRRGRVIAFGGRVLDKDDGPKYLNSPETTLFHKGRELYGLWQVRQAHTRIPRIVVVEGYMDVVTLWQFGVNTAVATLGTATTSEHAELLFRNSSDVYFCFDGDEAGRRAAWKAMESVLPRMKDGRQAFFLFLPEGEDPDSLVRKEGSMGFDRRLEQATPLSTFFFDHMSTGIQLASIDGKARLAERARPLVERIPDGAFRDLMRAELSRLTGLGNAQQSQMVPTPAAKATASNSPANAGPNARRSLVRTAIALLLHRPMLASACAAPYGFEHLDQPGVPLLIELLGLCGERPNLVTGGLLELFQGREELAALQKLAQMDFPGDETTLREELSGALAQLARQYRQQRIVELRSVGTLDDAGKRELRELLSAR